MFVWIKYCYPKTNFFKTSLYSLMQYCCLIHQYALHNSLTLPIITLVKYGFFLRDFGDVWGLDGRDLLPRRWDNIWGDGGDAVSSSLSVPDDGCDIHISLISWFHNNCNCWILYLASKHYVDFLLSYSFQLSVEFSIKSIAVVCNIKLC